MLEIWRLSARPLVHSAQPLNKPTAVAPMPLSKRSNLISNTLMPNHIPCFAVKRRGNICIPHHPHHAALTPKPCLHCSKVYGIKAKFLSFHRERGEAEEYCLRMFHIPTALTAHSLHPSFISFFLISHLFALFYHISPFSPPLCLSETVSFLPKQFSSIPTSHSFNFPPFLLSPSLSISVYSVSPPPLLSYLDKRCKQVSVLPGPPLSLSSQQPLEEEAALSLWTGSGGRQGRASESYKERGEGGG